MAQPGRGTRRADPSPAASLELQACSMSPELRKVFNPLPCGARCCAYTQRTYPNGHALGDQVPTASTGPSRPLLHMRLKAFAGPFGVCYQVVTRTTWQLVAESGSHLNSISSQTAAAAVAPSRATTRCPASLLASRRTYTALYRIYPLQRLSRYLSLIHI